MYTSPDLLSSSGTFSAEPSFKWLNQGGVRSRLGRYELLGKLAEGGMAEIYLGRLSGPSGFARPVVVKRIHTHLAQEPYFRGMFADEARLAARLRHRNVVQVHELSQEQGELFLVMEFVEGESVDALLRRVRQRGVRLPFGTAMRIVADACAGLHAAHEMVDDAGTPQNLVHRDVSPHNLMINYDGDVKVLDFGVAKTADSSVKTQTGTVKGKFRYMAPEQLRGESLDRRTDIFALGVVLFELSTGRHLFDGKNEVQTIQQILNLDVPWPRDLVEDYPRELERIVLKALAGDREYRFETADGMRRELLRAAGSDALASDHLSHTMREFFPDRLQKTQSIVQRARAGLSIGDLSEQESTASVPWQQGASRNSMRGHGTPGIDSVARMLNLKPRRRFSAGHFIAVAAAVGLIAGVAGVLRFEESTPADVPASVLPAASAREMARTAPEETLETKAPTDPVVEPREYSLTVVSEPSSAEVLLDGKPIGTTPLTVAVPAAGQKRTLRIQRAGFRAIHRDFQAVADRMFQVRLDRLRSAVRSTRSVPKARSAAADSPVEPSAKKSIFIRFD